MTVTLRSFAKINLGLRIGARRDDGFHELLTVYQTIGLYDLIQIRIERGSGIEILCTDPRVPRDETNTCYRIAELAMQSLGLRGRIVIKIQKRLPIQGGLGAASSNAVSTLIGLQRVLRKSLPAIESLRIAAEVGSDLPLFLLGGTVLGAGRGEEVYPLADLPATACVVVTPEVGVSTPSAFADWDETRAAGPDSAGKPRATLPRKFQRKLTLTGASDRMNELGCSVSAWLSEQYFSRLSGPGSRTTSSKSSFLSILSLLKLRKRFCAKARSMRRCQVRVQACTGCSRRKPQRWGPRPGFGNTVGRRRRRQPFRAGPIGTGCLGRRIFDC
jgi:4-diphosphocytidyl-2C-methyl-D-erythritol kinase